MPFTSKSNWVGARLITRLNRFSASCHWNIPEKFLILNFYILNPFSPLTYFIISDRSLNGSGSSDLRVFSQTLCHIPINL